MKILVGSKNPIKIDAVKDAFQKYFSNIEVQGIDTDSKVSHTPFNDDNFIGANNRAIAMKGYVADYYVGIEGGIIREYNEWFLTTVVCIIDNNNRVAYGIGPGVSIPESMVKEIQSGMELGVIADRIAGQNNTKQHGGLTEVLTKGITQRKDPTVQAIIRALIPFINEELYF